MLKKLNKKNILLIGTSTLTLIIVIILVIIVNKNTNNNKVSEEEKRFKEEYESLNNKLDNDGNKLIEVSISSGNIIKYSTETEILNIINNNGDAVVYLGYPTCNYCRASVEVLLEASKDSKLDNIYYIDTNKTKLSEDLANVIKENISEEAYSSLVLFINDGEIVSYNTDTLSSHKDQNKKLFPSQKEGLSEIYRYGINDVVASKEIKDN